MTKNLPKYECCFIVLHYMNYEATRECVDSILSLSGIEKSHVIIMDNGSMNGSGENLRNHYDDNCMVDVIVVNTKNGFSRGNNIAYDYVRNHFDCDFIIFTNNDIIFDDNKFIKKTISSYERSHFDVMGPDIITVGTKAHCSPLREKILTHTESEKLLKTYKMMRQYTALYLLFRKIKHIFNPDSDHNYGYYNGDKESRQVVLCGACLVMSTSFLNSKGMPFYPETKFYFEEEILTYQVLKNNGTILYDPSIYVLHNHSRSTKSAYSNKIKRQKFQASNDYNSLKIYMNLISKEENK